MCFFLILSGYVVNNPGKISEGQTHLCRIVMYIPDAADITLKNKFFSKNEDTKMFDTRDAGQNILRAMRDAHGEQLRALPQMLGGGSGSLLDLCNTADKGTDVRVYTLVTFTTYTVFRMLLQ